MASSATELYLTGLRNAHAVEQQAIQLLQRQVERLENYAALEQRMREHIEESRTQAKRIETVLEGFNSSNSTLKDLGLAAMGNLAALAHVTAPDEVVKNSFANYAFEHFEIAAYRSLLVLAEAAGDASGPKLLRDSLAEEERMAQWIADHLEETTRTYLTLETSGRTAGV